MEINKIRATNIDLKFMEIAIQEAKKGMSKGGIPIGAVLVKDNKIIGRAHNMRIQTGNHMAHAEMESLKGALKEAGKDAVRGSTVYSTMMPCSMCAGAIVHYGVSQVIGGENRTFPTGEEILKAGKVKVNNLQNEECRLMLKEYILSHREYWEKDIEAMQRLTRDDSIVEVSTTSVRNPNWSAIREDLAILVTRLHQELGWFDKESVANTPDRIMRFYKELRRDEYSILSMTKFPAPESQHNTLVQLSNIKTYSICQHHMLPFECNVSIGYLPGDGKVIGLSKLSRVAAKFASKPTMQELMTQQIVDFLNEELKPSFVMSMVEGRHHCSMVRGVKQQSATFTTSSVRWDREKLSDTEMQKLKEEFLITVRYANGGIYEHESKNART